MKVTIDNVFKTETAQEVNFNGLERTWFNADNKTMYLLHKPGNAPKTGDQLEGSYKEDARKQLKFTKVPQFPVSAPGPQTASTPVEKVYKADPAKQTSIEWQASIKAAVEAVRDYHVFRPWPEGNSVQDYSLEDYKREIVNTAITFAAVVEMKPSKTIQAGEPDVLPTEEQVAAAFGMPTEGIDLSDNPLGDM